MNLHDPKHPWNRLIAAARTVSDDRDSAAPYGFTTRVVALAFSPEGKVASLFERFALRAVGIACLLALMSVAVNYKTLAGGSTGAMSDDLEPVPTDDPVAALLDA